jgi:hypothetical protein
MGRVNKKNKPSESPYVSSDCDRGSQLSDAHDSSESGLDFDLSDGDSDPDFSPQRSNSESEDGSETEGSAESKFVKAELQKI